MKRIVTALCVTFLGAAGGGYPDCRSRASLKVTTNLSFSSGDGAAIPTPRQPRP